MKLIRKVLDRDRPSGSSGIWPRSLRTLMECGIFFESFDGLPYHLSNELGRIHYEACTLLSSEQDDCHDLLVLVLQPLVESARCVAVQSFDYVVDAF